MDSSYMHDPTKLEYLFSQGPIVIFQWRADENWSVEYVSPNIEQFGYSQQDFLTGKIPYASIVYPDDLTRVAEEVAQYSQSDSDSFEQEYRIVTAEKQVIWTYDFTRIIRDESGTISHYVGYVMDNNRHKQALEDQTRLQEEIIEAQKKALQDLSTPIIPLFEGVLVMPLIGSIDTARSRDIMRNLLAGISEYRAKTVIVDITGVPVVDSGVADHLNKTIQAARLKGAHTIVTGISDAVAETIVDLGIDWSEVQTMRDLQSGLLLAIENAEINLNT